MLDITNIFTEYPNVVDTYQLQNMLGVGRCKALELLHENKIQYTKIGRKYYIAKQWVIDYLNRTSIEIN